ncbi:MAG: beta-lactamase domain protein [Verrucomicrobiaceae bacterium]|nr:beta-lactamase domain protein [Verrucomicrobiaceae bacterium]
MARYESANHHFIKAIEWVPENPAERINDHLFFSRSTSNSYLVTTDDGDVIINAGMPYQGERTRERYEQLLGRKLDVRKIIFTQSHPDHMGGWAAFAEAQTEVIAQQRFFEIRAERNLLAPFFAARGARLLAGLLPNPEHVRSWHQGVKELETATLFSESHAFELGGRRFELYSTPSGETIDSLIVWLPADKAVFTGNLFGALYGALPHFSTPRGDRQRSTAQFLRDITRVIELKPELLITGHDEPIVGAARIERDLTQLRNAVQYIHDETLKGMNAKTDLFTLMREIKLPSNFKIAAGRGPVSWYVRAVWEEYTGWFRQESTTELYGTPPKAIWSELAELAGGPDVLIERARQHVAAGRAVEALHFTDIALSVDPSHRTGRETEIAALEQLAERNEGRHYDELGWIENEIKTAKNILGKA